MARAGSLQHWLNEREIEVEEKDINDESEDKIININILIHSSCY